MRLVVGAGGQVKLSVRSGQPFRLAGQTRGGGEGATHEARVLQALHDIGRQRRHDLFVGVAGRGLVAHRDVGGHGVSAMGTGGQDATVRDEGQRELVQRAMCDTGSGRRWDLAVVGKLGG